MKRTLWRALIVIALLANFLMVLPVAARVPPPDEPIGASLSPATPALAKLPPKAIGSIRLDVKHERAPREDVVVNWLKDSEAIPLNATEAQIQAAVEGYYARFYKKNPDWVSPKIQELALKHEAELAIPGARAQAIQPITATVLAMAVDFGATETFTMPVADANGDCVTQTVTITGPLKGNVPAPGPRDNNTIWYSPTQTADPSFYANLAFGYQGIVGRVRTDLTGPDGLPGVDLSGLTVQDYYDNVAGPGNVYITGTFGTSWVTVPHSEGYYGAPQCGVDSDSGVGRVGQVVVDALKVFSNTHPSYYTDTSDSAFWKRFDANHDGVVDAFWTVHAGMGQEAGGGAQGDFAIWSHSWSLSAQGFVGGVKVYEGDPITTTDDIYVDPYTVQPENLDLGVLVEEFGHNFFGLPDLYTTDAENSIGFWTEMGAGSWGGYLGGTAPVGMPLWFRMNAYCDTGFCGWEQPMVTRQYTETAGTVTIGQLEKTPDGVNKGVRVNLPSISEQVLNRAGTGKAAYSDTGRDDLDIALERPITVTASATGTLTFSTYWNIEKDYDYGYVQIVSGTQVATLCDMDGVFTTANPNGGNLGCGLTGSTTVSRTLRFNLSAYKGKTVTLRLRYVTDPGTTGAGWWVDNVKLDGALIDDFESADGSTNTFPGWTSKTNAASGWHVAPISRLFANYYLVEWRAKTKYDQMVKTAYVTMYNNPATNEWQVARVPYNIPGALLYYRNAKYPTGYSQRGYYGDPPSFGPKNKLLVVDMNPGPLRYGTTAPYTAYLNSRSASYDAALTLQDTQAFTLTQINAAPAPISGTFVYPVEKAVTKFSDGLGYYAGFYAGAPCAAGYICYANRDGSAVIPARGKYSTRVTDYDGNPLYDYYGAGFSPSWLGSGNPRDDNVQYGVNIELLSKAGDDAYNSTAMLRFQDVAMDRVVGPAPANIVVPGVYTFTYWIALTNQSPATVNGTITMTLPAGLNFVSATPASGGTMLPPGGGAGVERTFVWPGYSLPASTPITFTLVATTEVKSGDPHKVWTANAYVDDGVNPVSHDSWTTGSPYFTYLPVIQRN